MSTVNFYVRQWLKAELGTVEAALTNLSTDFAHDFAARNDMGIEDAARLLIETEAEGSMEVWRRHWEERNWAAAAHLADGVIKKQGLDIKPETAEYHRLCQKLTLACAEYHATRMERAAGNWDYDPLGSGGRFSPEMADDAIIPGIGEPLATVISAYLDERERVERLPPKRVTELRGSLNLFAEWVGRERSVSTIDARTVGDFRSLLTKLPANHRKRFPKKTLRDVVEYAIANRITAMRVPTINGHLQVISGFFEWATSGGFVPSNPAAKVRVKAGRSYEEAKRGIFDADHLEKMFRSPLYMGCRSERFTFEYGDIEVRNWKFWVPLIGLYTGARLGEICQLRPEDVVQVDGIWCFNIGRDGGRTVKTDSGVRIVPIHSELQRIGILSLATSQKASGSLTLLPALPPPQAGYASNRPSKWFAHYLEKTLGADVKRKENLVNHGLRHTILTRMREAGIDEGLQFRLVGHKDRQVTSHYGEFPPMALADAMERVKQPVDLSHLYRGA